jgi:hypothetical protein
LLPSTYIALPVLDELDLIPRLLSDLSNQSYLPEEVVICVNQPEDWWNNEHRKYICQINQEIIRLLENDKNLNIKVIDRSSQGKGWQGRQSGIGWARKTVMDSIADRASQTDIIISMDADSSIVPNYLFSVVKNLADNPKSVGLSVPYYHRLTAKDDALDRAMLRYEIYMRSYSINLWRIGSPYSFTALGSAIAMPVWAYKAIGGITPQKSGEDFYLLQKLRKFGPLLFWNEEKVYPETRFSDRVFFGTGPALTKGVRGEWDSYPIYSISHFNEVKTTYDMFVHLFNENLETPMTFFLETIFGSGFWEPLRKNAHSVENFVKACHQKVDALRILQYLKWRNKQEPGIAEECIAELIARSYMENKFTEVVPDLTNFSFDTSPLVLLNGIRDFLMKWEELFQRKHADNFNQINNNL